MGQEGPEDRELVREWLAGNDRAYSLLFHRYYPRLRHYARRSVPDGRLLEEMIMDVLLGLWRRKAHINPEIPISAYIFRSMRNRMIDQLRQRREKLIPLSALAEAPPAAHTQADNRILHQETDAQIRRGIDRLSPGRKRVFVLSRLHGHSYSEIADQLNISKNTIANHMSVSLKCLRIFVEREMQ